MLWHARGGVAIVRRALSRQPEPNPIPKSRGEIMRKLIWCGSAAGLLVIGGMIAVSYYAGCHPNSTVGRCIRAAASATLVIQPAAHFGTTPQGSTIHAIPADPQPIVPPQTMEPAEAGVADNPEPEENHDLSPIIIKEEELLPANEELNKGPTAEIPTLNERNFEVPASAAPMHMPYCTDDDEATAKKEDQATNPLKASAEESFKEWMKMYKGAEEANDAAAKEEIPDLPQTGPKCQEDIHRHEQYSGCPHTTGPCKGKSGSSGTYKSGREESSEAPKKRRKKPSSGKECEKSKSCPHPQGVDTMEYRKSDGRLNEYGHGPY